MVQNAVILPAEIYNDIINRMSKMEKCIEQLLSNPSAPEWYDVNQAKEKLGCCAGTIREMANDGRLEKRQGQRKIYVSSKSVIEKIQEQILK